MLTPVEIFAKGGGKKTLKGNFGKLLMEIQRDRDGTFEPKTSSKIKPVWSGFDDEIPSVHVWGITVREANYQIQIVK